MYSNKLELPSKKVRDKMKRVKIILFTLIILISSIGIIIFTVPKDNSNDVETVIKNYINYIQSNKWDEYVNLFDYEENVKNDLLLFLKNDKNQTAKEGIHGIEAIKLISIKPTNDSEFITNGEYAYDVLLDMRVNKPSEFYMNGVTRHVFVFKMTADGLKIETIYFKGLYNKE